jgi:hypothetical protein
MWAMATIWVFPCCFETPFFFFFFFFLKIPFMHGHLNMHMKTLTLWVWLMDLEQNPFVGSGVQAPPRRTTLTLAN